MLWNYLEFGPVVQEEMLFKDISYLEIWLPTGELTATSLKMCMRSCNSQI